MFWPERCTLFNQANRGKDMNKKVFALALAVAFVSGGYSELKHRRIASAPTQIAKATTFSEFSKKIIHYFPEVKSGFLDNIEVYKKRNDATLEKLTDKKIPIYAKRAALSSSGSRHWRQPKMAETKH